MATFNVNLNIYYSAPQEVWDKIEKCYAEMPQEEWNEWLQIFKLTQALGYAIGEPEDGYEFKYWK